MTSPPHPHPLQSPQLSDADSSLPLPKTRRAGVKSPLSSLTLPYRPSNASLSSLFASTSSLPTSTPSASGANTPTAGVVDGSPFSPGSRASIRSPPPVPPGQEDEARLLTFRAFAPHVSVLASPDCEELLRHKGINGGLLELLRPFGERIAGRVVIRDSTGASRPYDDFGVRFTGVRDGLESPRLDTRASIEGQERQQGSVRDIVPEFRPARLRTGGDIAQIDEVVERHLAHSEEQPTVTDYLNHNETTPDPKSNRPSPFYLLYLRRLLSGLPLSPHETFSHPVALVIAISSRNPAPLEELRSLYSSSNTGEHRLPQWVNNEYLRYYVLIHDEDYDDIGKSTALYEQMKRHFGLHCHLLRLRSNQCLPSDDDSTRLPTCDWMSAGEELAEIANREVLEDDEDPSPYIFESDAAALRAFVREMVTQSIIPTMERLSATWNDQVASRRRGISGRFMSLSKRFTPFSGRSVSGSAGGPSGSNYDALQGFYKPDTAEAIMRKLGDYAYMLRDFKLAQSTYDILCTDFKNDKAWKYYAGASEMAAITALLISSTMTAKYRMDTLDQLLEAAHYSYLTRCSAPYNALRTLTITAELLRLRGGSALDDAARWASRVIEDRLVGPTGHALVAERIASCFASRSVVGSARSGSRSRKAGFWNIIASEAWLRLDKPKQAEKRLVDAMYLYEVLDDGAAPLGFESMNGFVEALQNAVEDGRTGVEHGEEEDGVTASVEPMQEASEHVEQRSHRKSMSQGGGNLSFDPLGAAPLIPLSPTMDRSDAGQDGFE
ncbi:hypothetical protein MBLNU459_g1854t1 [Dothideomycetes sp. NU459]